MSINERETSPRLARSVRCCKFTREIESLTVERGRAGFAIRLQLPDKFYILQFQRAWEARLWSHAIRKAKEFESTRAATIHGALKFNIENIHLYHFEKLDGELAKEVSSVAEPLRADLDSTQFSAALAASADLWSHLADALYAKKPFVLPMFAKIASLVHNEVAEAARTFWNRYSRGMSHSAVSFFAQGLFTYENALAGWGVFDRDFEWKKPLVSTYLARLSPISALTLAKLISSAPASVTREKGLYTLSSAVELEAHLWMIFSFYPKAPFPEVGEALLKFCASVIDNFLLELLISLKECWLKSKFYIALVNNTFVRVIKGVQRKISAQSNSSISLPAIREYMRDSGLVTMVTRIEQEALFRLRKSWRRKVKKTFSASSEFTNRDFPALFSQTISKFREKSTSIESPFIQKSLLCEILLKICSFYIGIFVENTGDRNFACTPALAAKILADTKALGSLLSEAGVESPTQYTSRLQKLYQFAQTDDLDICIASLLSLQVFYKKIFSKTNIDRVIKTKIYFPQKSLEYISSSFKGMIASFSKQSVARQRTRATIISIFLAIFLAVRLRKAAKKSLKIAEKRRSRASVLFSLADANSGADGNLDRIYETKGFAQLIKFSPEIEDPDLEDLARKEKNPPKVYVTFKPDILVFYKDQGEKYVLGNILYKAITSLGQLEAGVVIRTKKEGYLFILANYGCEKADLWTQNLTILRDKQSMVKVQIVKVEIKTNANQSDKLWMTDQPKFVFDYDREIKKLHSRKL